MGKLNILHHKSFHVYNRDNIERVKRDERIAELEAQSSSQRSLAADSEARIALLRDRARDEKAKSKKRGVSEGEKALARQLEGKGKEREDEDVRATIIRPDKRPSGDDDDEAARPPRPEDTITSKGHVNFWANQESAALVPSTSSSAQNASYLRDKKRAEDKWDEQITMYLGKPAKELRPWYSDKELKSGEERKRTDEQRLELAYKDGESKRLSDPLALMNGYLRQRDAALSVSNPSFTADGRPNARPDPERFRPSMLSNRRKRRQASTSPPPPEKRRRDSPPVDDDDFAPALPPSLAVARRPEVSAPKESKAKAMKVDFSAERARAAALLASGSAKRRRVSSSVASTPRTDAGSTYGDAYNREAVLEAREARRRGRDGRERWRGDVDEERWRQDREKERDRYWEEDRDRRPPSSLGRRRW